MNHSLVDLDYKKKFISQSVGNKNKLQNLADKQKSRLDLQFR